MLKFIDVEQWNVRKETADGNAVVFSHIIERSGSGRSKRKKLNGRDYLIATKDYVLVNATGIVTAAAAVSLVVLVRNYIQAEANRRTDNASIIGFLRDNNIQFEFYPGVGVWGDMDAIPTFSSDDDNE